jgi:putative Mn2+ efflux pump MntP
LTLEAFVKVLFVALSLSLDVFAVCIGVGMRGADRATKVRIGIAFTAAELTMTVVGAVLGRAAGEVLGDAAGYVGFTVMVGVGIYMIIETLREAENPAFDFSRGMGLVLGALSISLDSLGIGFSILYIGVPFGLSLAMIAAASVTATTSGLALGRALGRRAEEWAAVWAGIILIVTGVAFALLKFAGHGV